MIPENRALLVMDFQDGIANSFVETGIVERMRAVIVAARAKAIPVIFVVVGFRPGHPEVSGSNKSFSGIKAAGRLVDPTVIDALSPLESEPVVVKRRVSAFGTTDLATILQALGARHLILAGISTSGVVLSTTRMAADLDFEITILADCCADGDEEVHRVLTEKIFPRQATVTTGEAFIATLTQ